MTSTYLGKKWVHFLELPFLKCKENVVSLFKNTYNKKKSPFLFENDIFCYVVSFLCFPNKALDKVYRKQVA